MVYLGRGEGRGAATRWVPRPSLLEKPPEVLVNPGEAQPEGGQAAPGQAGAKGVFSSREEKRGISYTLPPVHGKEGLWHSERGFDAPELGFISAHPRERSL